MAKLLGDFLVSSGFVPKNALSKSVVSLLKAHKSFNLTDFVFDYIRYEKLFEVAGNLWSLMKRKHCCEKARPPSFDDVLGLCPPDSSQPYEDQLTAISVSLVASKFSKYELTKDQEEQIGLVATLLFLVGVGDQACKSLFG